MQIISYYGNVAPAQTEESHKIKRVLPPSSHGNYGKVGAIYSFQSVSYESENRKTKNISAVDYSFVTTFFSYLLALSIAVLVPVYIYFNIDIRDNSFSLVDLTSHSSTGSEEIRFLDSTMEHFAFDFQGLIDSDGNVLDSEGNVILTEPSFREPVTFETYRVKSGDTISGITKNAGLSNVSTLIAINDISNVRSLRSGQKLTIPSMDGLLHTIKEGESLASLSVKYGVTVEDLLDVNDLASQELEVGKALFIPGAKLDNNTLHSALGDLFICPLTRKYTISSKFGSRVAPADIKTGRITQHTGIDMAVPQGTPIRSSMAGKIVYAGYSPVYGNYVIIDHGNGYQTLYAHMYKILVSINQSVSQGTQIGLVGSTGYSTGPHLHFSVYKNGKLIDPLTVLK